MTCCVHDGKCAISRDRPANLHGFRNAVGEPIRREIRQRLEMGGGPLVRRSGWPAENSSSNGPPPLPRIGDST